MGNNFPVFFVRDGIKFPDMVHALKPNPKNHIQEGWRIADFFSHIPESMHMVSLQASHASARLPRALASCEGNAWCCQCPHIYTKDLKPAPSACSLFWEGLACC